jgi:hypothetical protein
MDMTSQQADGRIVLRPRTPFNGVKVFSATMYNELVEIRVTQSSDASFHCIALTVFYRSPTPAAG